MTYGGRAMTYKFFLRLPGPSVASWLLVSSLNTLMNAMMWPLNYSHFHQFHLSTW